ncbi:MAG: GNAT family N-acetyltransferase [Candidatus Pacebacteria bacterium]|nr:GNAT family N-acetyltransferase [Candidatus Paceibacterota bacterium]
MIEKDREIKGFGGYGKSRDEDALKRVGEVYAIYLDHTVFGAGLGTILLGELEKALRENNFTSATLWVLATNVQARKFYEAKGWTLDGREKIEIKDGTKLVEVRYRKELKLKK